ncbi:MAG: hypothetical protein RIQ46_842 [Pseudomonadota bacterium]
MAASALTREEGLGLGLAVAAHVVLVAFLVLRPSTPLPLPKPERIMVTLSEDVGLTSTSPEPAARAMSDAGPEPGEAIPEPAPEPEPAPPPPKPEPPKPLPKAEPPKPQPQPKSQAKPQPRPSTQPSSRPSPVATTRAATRPAAAPTRPAAAARPGASRFDDAFKQGVPGGQQATGTSRNPPAATIGPAVRSALAGAISREIKPRWVAPQGAEVELLVTVLSWNLNPDGTLAGTPRVVRQDGITDANRPQAARHAEQAIRAVQLAAPFDLPPEYYDAWKRVAEFRFDRKLSQ